MRLLSRLEYERSFGASLGSYFLRIPYPHQESRHTKVIQYAFASSKPTVLLRLSKKTQTAVEILQHKSKGLGATNIEATVLSRIRPERGCAHQQMIGGRVHRSSRPATRRRRDSRYRANVSRKPTPH